MEEKLNEVDFSSKGVVSNLNQCFTKFQGLFTYCYSVCGAYYNECLISAWCSWNANYNLITEIQNKKKKVEV